MRPPMMLMGRKRNFIAPGNVYPSPRTGTRHIDMTSERAATKQADEEPDDTELGASGNGGTPDDPTDLGKRNWKQLLKRTAREFQDDNLTDWAAALTYYAVLALFPAVLVLVALLGLVGQYPQTTNALLDIVGKLGPASAVDTFRKPIEGVVQSKGGAGALLGFGLLGALWSASGYIGAFFRASNIVWDIEEGRP